MSEKKLTDWTLGEVMELCKGRTGTHACAGCPMESEMEHDYCRLADVTWPDHWEIPMPNSCKPTPDGEDKNATTTDIPVTDVPATGKPRLCGLLNVDVGEPFKFSTPNREYGKAYIAEDGVIWTETVTGYTHKVGGNSVCWIINHPQTIKKLPPKPKLTEAEISICKAMGAKWVSRDCMSINVELWTEKPEEEKNSREVWYQGTTMVAHVVATLFPSISPRDCVEVP